MTNPKPSPEKEERIYCRFCGAKLKKDKFGLVCPQDWTHNEEVTPQ